MEYVFESELYEWQGKAAWFFLNLPVDFSAEIKEVVNGLTNGFGSVRVDVTIGVSKWRTSIFPDSKAGAFMLPVKAEVRKANALTTGSTVRAVLELVDF